MASLSEQLKLAASSDATRLARGASSAASFLYNAREAANFTLDQIFSVGSNGFHALVQQNTGIAPLADILLSDKSRRTDRSLLDKKQVDILNASLDQTLRLLSPYTLQRPCGQALEWLIRRFRVNDFNINALFEMLLPFHETAQFAQMLQIIDLDKDAAFRQLQAVKKSMQPLPRHMLVSYMTRNTDLARFVINLLPNAIVHPHSPPSLDWFLDRDVAGLYKSPARRLCRRDKHTATRSFCGHQVSQESRDAISSLCRFDGTDQQNCFYFRSGRIHIDNDCCTEDTGE